jgi:hypothetical protein
MPFDRSSGKPRRIMRRSLAMFFYVVCLSTAVAIAIDWFSSYRFSGLRIWFGESVLQQTGYRGRLWFLWCGKRGAAEFRLLQNPVFLAAPSRDRWPWLPTVQVIDSHIVSLNGDIPYDYGRAPGARALGFVFGIERSWGPSNDVVLRYVALPHWAMLLLACGCFYASRRWLMSSYPRAKASHRCTTCGYDLRATPDRCPECGTIPTTPPSPRPLHPATQPPLDVTVHIRP